MEQKDLLGKYIASFADNGLELKVYLNEEIGRLKGALLNALTVEEVSSDATMVEKAKQVIAVLEGFRQEPPSQKVIHTVLKIQKLVGEINADD